MGKDKQMAAQFGELRLFKTCTRRELQAIARRFTEYRVPAGRTLIKEGIPGREFFVIVSGTATVRHGDAVVASLGPGDFAGELALLAVRNRTASVVAETDLVRQVCSRLEFNQVLDLSPHTTRMLLADIARRVQSVGFAI